MHRFVLVLPLVALVVAACSDSEPRAASTASPSSTSGTLAPPPSPSPSPSASRAPVPVAPPPSQEQLDAVSIRLEQVGTVPRANWVTEHEGELYALSLLGQVYRLSDGSVVGDISEQVSTDGEGGLYSLAFSPDGRRAYLSFLDTELRNRVVEYPWRGGRLDTASPRDVFTAQQPSPIHNGGQIGFGPDGFLWLAIGDGGLRFSSNAQDLSNPLGTMVRIDPTGGQGYEIPPGNPFVNRADAEPEIWAYGLRNPWRWSFDPPTGTLWIGDVGLQTREEVDRLALDRQAGANLGWPALEGTYRLGRVPVPADTVPPTFEYPSEGEFCGVVGGYVYRGTQVTGLPGAYVFGDICRAEVQAISVSDSGEVVAERTFDVQVPPRTLVSFGQGEDGELYVVSIDGPIYRIAPG